MFPLARREDLIVEEVGNETLVYDQHAEKAHCLNSAAAAVWRHCDGHTSREELSRLLAFELNVPPSLELVDRALGELEAAHLMGNIDRRAKGASRMTRRELAIRFGVAAALVPAVMTILSPNAAAAASCLDPGVCCAANAQCCSAHCTVNDNNCPGPSQKHCA